MISALERLADCIRNRRKLMGMSQEMLAEKTGLSLSLIRRIERRAANPTLTNLEKIASVLGEDIADLFYRQTEQDTNKLRKHLILTGLSQLSVNQLLLIHKLVESFQQEKNDEYITTALENIPMNWKLKDSPTISPHQGEEDEYLPTTIGNIQVTWKVKDNESVSTQQEGEDEYLPHAIGKIPVERKMKDNPSVSPPKG